MPVVDSNRSSQGIENGSLKVTNSFQQSSNKSFESQIVSIMSQEEHSVAINEIKKRFKHLAKRMEGGSYNLREMVSELPPLYTIRLLQEIEQSNELDSRDHFVYEMAKTMIAVMGDWSNRQTVVDNKHLTRFVSQVDHFLHDLNKYDHVTRAFTSSYKNESEQKD